jgi:hypothetical protein
VSIETILAELTKERDRLDRAIIALNGAEPSAAIKKPIAVSKAKVTASPQKVEPRKAGGITPAGRKKLSEAMKKRWAERRRKKQKGL